MERKKQLPRKQKRAFTKILTIVFGVIGIGVGMLVGILSSQLYTDFRSGYLSPLASAEFMKSVQTDSSQDQLTKGLAKAKIETTEIKRSEQSTFTVKLKRGGEVIFSAKKDIGEQIASLQYILSHLTMEDRQFKRLDLRYDKPVIVFE